MTASALAGLRARLAALLLIATLAAVAGCGGASGAAVPIEYGHRDCDFCRMTITDPRYAAELVTTTGKVHPFDSIECLAGYYAQLADRSSARALWVSDYAHPGHFLRADSARFVRVAGPGSPMGRGLRAYAASADVSALRASGGEPLDWAQVLALVTREGVAPGATSRVTDEARDALADAR